MANAVARALRALAVAVGLLVPLLPGACSSDDSAEVSTGGVATVPDTPGVLLEVTVRDESGVVRIYGSDDGAGTVVVTAIEMPSPHGALRLDVDETARTLAETLGSFGLDLEWNAAGDVVHFQTSFGGVPAHAGGPVSAAKLPDLGLPKTTTSSVQSLSTSILSCTETVRALFVLGSNPDPDGMECIQKDPAVAEGLFSVCVVRELLVAFSKDTNCAKTIYEEECKARLALAEKLLSNYAKLLALATVGTMESVYGYWETHGSCPQVSVPDAGTDAGSDSGGTDSATDGGPGSISACNALGDIGISAQLKSESPGSYCTGDLVFTNSGSKTVTVLFYIDETKPLTPEKEQDAFWQISVGPGATVKTVTPAFSWQNGGSTITTTDVAAVYLDANDDSCLWIITDLTEDEVNDCGISTTNVAGMNMCTGG
ncbi:MAG: hypothetical protein KC776_01860 [Myxococcales bacterium]|nr:hypothetical protein [Myxococcales bacterium]MCB9579495.1 hypothetical protein [Polyangiaceae bacterium]